jgi:hypothetical protein
MTVPTNTPGTGMVERGCLTASELLSMLARPQFGDPSGPWCAWFAWRPVRTVDARWAWMRRIWRRRYHTKPYLDGPQFKWWIYARADNYAVWYAVPIAERNKMGDMA